MFQGTSLNFSEIPVRREQTSPGPNVVASGGDVTTALDRANHTGTQLAATISDFTETAQDVVGAMVAAAGGSYDDTAGTITLPGGSALTFASVEVDLGAAKTGGKFTIAGSGLTVGKPVLIQQAVGPYTDKGTRADEAEMDQVQVTASVTAANIITAYWSAPRRVRGNFKFNYVVGA